MDLFRYCGNSYIGSFIKHFFLTPGFKVTFYIRICKYIRNFLFLKYTLYPFLKFLYWRVSYKYGILIPLNCQIGQGFYIGHFGNIVIHHRVIIGDNCNISHGVTIGLSSRGPRRGCPVIGNNVYIGPGAKIFGAISIGDNSAIGANCVVTKDVPAHATIVGVPGKLVSYKGSENYIIRTEYC